MLTLERLENQKIKAIGNNTTKGPKQESQNRLRSLNPGNLDSGTNL
jgi:hypothetical protein